MNSGQKFHLAFRRELVLTSAPLRGADKLMPATERTGGKTAIERREEGRSPLNRLAIRPSLARRHVSNIPVFAAVFPFLLLGRSAFPLYRITALWKNIKISKKFSEKHEHSFDILILW